MKKKEREEKLIQKIFMTWKGRELRNKAIQLELAKMDLELAKIELENHQIKKQISKKQIEQIKATALEEEDLTDYERPKRKLEVKTGDPAAW